VILSEWLHDRTPAPPAQLSARIQETLAEHFDDDASAAADVCVAAAEQLLRELLARPSAGRESALDLLTVDALVTYAFEAASDDPDSLGDHASLAMTRLAATASH
jgi:hypothetical protein